VDHDAQSSEETIFSTALRYPPSERAAYLAAACANQPTLRARIEELLDAQSQIGEFMEQATSVDVSARKPSQPDGSADVTNRQIGRYKLLQKIGEGGCGVVYMAEQAQPVKRRVALKLIKLGMDTESVIARFEAERQALAMMDHPNIAKVYDAGATETGRPYFVMELVRGVRITEFCDQHQLTTVERLHLFIQVCQAVQHAHQKGIIHRDLKPSNILVTIHDPGSRGVPKIIDFGIAKATQGRLTDQTLFTAFEQFLGTPAYMSPEQTLMTTLDVDTRSDIYSLGVLLYELITGRTPFETKELLARGVEEMRRTIREKEPPRPSTRLSTLLAGEQASTARFRQTDPPRLVHLVRGDLDWIVMKCLEKDRTRRYETANALASDLQRHLQHESVAARPPSRWYEFQKAVRRHQVGFAATGAVGIALTLGLLLSAREARRARQAEQQTRQTAYVADMDLAHRALREDDLGTARKHLRRYWPVSHKTDLRQWEWRYLAHLSQGDPHHSLAAHSSQISCLRFLNGQTLLTAGKADWRTILWNLEERRPSTLITNLGFRGSVSDANALDPARNQLFYRGAWRRETNLAVVDLPRGIARSLDPTEQAFLTFDSPIASLDLSAKQDVLAVAYGRQVAMFNLATRRRLTTLNTESSPAAQALFSPDGQNIAIAEDSGRITLWDLTEHRQIGVLVRSPSSDEIRALRFSPNGQWLVSPGGPEPTQIWSVTDRVLVAELHDAQMALRAAFSPDNRMLAMAGGDASIRLWDTSSWRKTRTLRGHTDPVTAMEFSPDGQWLASGARNGEVKLWSMNEPPSGPPQMTAPAARYLRIASDGSGFVRVIPHLTTNGVEAATADVWTTVPLRRTFSIELPAGMPSSGVVLGDGRGLVVGGYDGSIRILGPTGAIEKTLSNAHPAVVYLVELSRDGSVLATKGMKDISSPEDRVRIWRFPSMELLAELPNAEDMHAIKLSDDGQKLAGFTGQGDMGVWSIPSMSGPPRWRVLAALQNVTVSAFSPDHRWLAVASDSDAFLLDLATHRRRALPRAQFYYQYTSFSFSPDGSRLAAGSEGEGRIFDTATGQLVLSLHEPGRMLAFTRDAERLLSLHREGASVLYAPALDELHFEWLKENPVETLPPYLGPEPNPSNANPP
jgi:serine/threonine protein kinase/WD40 repeat protein